MSTLNSASTWTQWPEKQKDQSFRVSALSDMLNDTLSDQWVSNENPEGINTYEENPDNFVTDLKVKMKEKRDGAKSWWKALDGWAAVTDKEIDELEISDINRKVLAHTKELISARTRLFSYIKDIYPDIRSYEDWESKIQEAIKGKKRSALEAMIKSPRSNTVRAFLCKSLDIDLADGTLTPGQKKDLKEIFWDLEWLPVSERKGVEQIFHNWSKFQNIPTLEEIGTLLKAKRFAKDTEKIRAIRAFSPTLPLSLLIENNLITADEIYKSISVAYGKTFTRLSEAEKQKFVSIIQNSSVANIPVSLDDLALGNIDRIFYSKNEKLNTITEAIQERLSIELPEKKQTSADILKKAAAEFPDEENHQKLFNLYVARHLTQKNEGKSIPGIENLGKWSVIEFGEGEDTMRFRIVETSEMIGSKEFPLEVNWGLSYWLRIEELPVKNWYLRQWETDDITYDALYGFFDKFQKTARVLSYSEFKENLTSDPSELWDGKKIYDARNIDQEAITRSNIAVKIDEYDSEWRQYGFGVGTYFKAPEEAVEWKAEVRTWKVSAMWDDWVELANESWKTERVSFDDIYMIAKAGRIKRVWKIENEQDFLQVLSKDHWIATDATIVNNNITQKNKDENGSEIMDVMRVFRSDSGGHIRINGIENGVVSFGEYTQSVDEHKATEYAHEKWTKSAYKKFYKEKVLTYGAFLSYISSQKMSASSSDVIDDHTHHEHDHDHPHIHGNILSKFGKWHTIWSMWKGFEMVWHSLEHTLEKWSKLDAARFAMKFWKFFGDSVEAQLYADIVDGSKEIVEKYKNKIANLPGPKGRWKCIHIAHNTDARPEEVMAAIQFMVSSYGQLYAEDIKHYQSVVTRQNLATKPQGYFAFLDNFIHTARLPGGVMEWRKKAYDKAKPELGWQWEPPEEMLLHALFKSIDGNPEKFPYAASVVKAIGGPGWFEKDWKFEGYKNAMQKWKDQTGMVDAQWRLNKAVWYLGTHELYKWVGAMEKVAGKNKEPKYQAFPFIWAVWWLTKYASPQALQDIKNYAQNGFSFHAYAFLQKEQDNLLYRNTVRLALADLVAQWKLWKNALDEFNVICKRFDNGPEDASITEKVYGKKAPPAAMMDWWQKYHTSGLNDMLQGHDGWLTKGARENETIKKYRQHFIWQHSTMLRDGNIAWTEYGKDWYDEHGVWMSLIMRDSEDKKWLRSLYSNLNKIKFAGPNRWGRPMDPNNKEKIWDYLVKNIKASKDISNFYGDEKLQREQFLFWREELISYFNRELNAWEVKDESDMRRLIKTPGYSYFQDFLDMGIDPMAIFKHELIKGNAEQDYKAWKSNGHSQGGGSQNIIETIRGKASGFSGQSGTESPTWRDPDSSSWNTWDTEIPYRNDD